MIEGIHRQQTGTGCHRWKEVWEENKQVKVIVLVLGLLSLLELHCQDWEVEEGVQLVTIQRMLSFLLPIDQSELSTSEVQGWHQWVWEWQWQMFEVGDIVLGTRQGEGLQSQQPQHKIEDPGSFLVQREW